MGYTEKPCLVKQKREKLSQTWWFTLVIPALGGGGRNAKSLRLDWITGELQASLGYKGRLLCLKKQQNQKSLL